jgi:hypothetical protein
MTVVINDRAGIHDARFTKRSAYIHDRPCHQYGAYANAATRANPSHRMHDNHQSCTMSKKHGVFFGSHPAVAYPYDDSIEFGNLLEQTIHIANHGPSARRPEGGPAVIKEVDGAPTSGHCRVRDNFAVPARTKDRNTFHSALPVNRVIVTCPSAAMPSRCSTLPTVRIRIRKSSNNDQLSTYQTSISNRSIHDVAFRPFT